MKNKNLLILFFGIVVNFHTYSQWADITSTIGGGITSTTNMAKPYVFDLNNDNYPDFLVPVLTNFVSPYTKYWKLFKNNGNSTFTDVTNSYGLPTNLTSTLGFIDYNGDGFKDLYFVNSIGPQIFKNNNGNSFTDVSTQLGITQTFFTSGETTSSFKVFDYDLDGDEDLLYTRTVSGANTLTAIVNNGTSFSTKVNILTSIPGATTGGINFSFFDMDNDGDFDVVFDAFSGTSQYSNGITTLYRKDSTGYINTTGTSGLVNGLPGGISTIDINQDGKLDIVKGGADCCTSPLYRVFIGNGLGGFTDQTSSYTINNGVYKWDPTLVDFDNDTDFDFSWSGYTGVNAAPFRLYANNNNVFTETSATYGLNLGVTTGGVPIDDNGNGIWIDLDKDGDLDIILNRDGSGSTSTTGNVWVKRNPLQGNYINIKLNGCGVNKSGIGAKIKLVVGTNTKWLYYEKSPDGNASNGTDTFHFGLGTATLINSITVYWPNNTTTILNNVSGNQFLTIGGGAGGSSAPTGSTAQTFCSGSTVANLTATGTNIKWYATSTGGTALASTTALVNGTTYYASQTVNGCESTTRLAVTVSLNNPTVSATATTVCSGQASTLTINDNLSTTQIQTQVNNLTNSGLWSLLVTYNNHYYLQYQTRMTWPQAKILCEQNGGYMYCVTSQLENNNVSIPIANSQVYGDFLLGLYQDTSDPNYSEPAGGWKWLDGSTFSYTNWASISSGWIVNEPSGGTENFGIMDWSNTGPYWNDTYNNINGTVIMEYAGYSTYLWSTGATTASISVNPTATTQYWVDVTTNGITCRKNITITVNSTTPAPTGSATQTLCSGSTVANLTATGTNIKWYATSTGGTTLASTTALINGTTYYASQAVNGCESTSRLAVVVSLNTAAGISLTSGNSNQDVYEGCQIQEIIYTLSGGATGVTTIGLPNWVDVTVVGTNVTISSSLSIGQLGNYNFTITTTGGCGTSSLVGYISVIPLFPPFLNSALGTDNQSVCIGATIQDISYINTNSNVPVVYNVQNLPSGVTYLFNGSQIIITGTPIQVGFFNYTVSAQRLGLGGQICSPIFATQGTITVTTANAPTGSATQTLCSGSTVANLTATGTNIQWYSASTGGTALASTTALVNGTTYYASQTVNGCESGTRLAVIVSLNNPTVSASVTTVCSGQPTTLTASDGNIQQPLSNKIAQFSNNISNTIALNYPSPVPTSNFSYDFWFNTSRTITLLSEKTGGVSVQAINGQNFVVFPSQPRGSGISVGTNGISVIEHSPYFFDSRFTQQINLTGWHHCAVVYTGNNFSLYIDGVLIGTRNNGSNFGGFGNTYSNVTLTQSIGEGYPGYDANDNYTGKIDEYRQWNVSLTVNQVQQIFNRKLLSNNMSECNVNLTFDQNNITNSSNIISAVSITNSNLPTFSTDNSFLIGGFVGSSIGSIINTNFSGTSSTSYLWSTGATTPTISVNPTSTTPYWVDVTTNGVTCRKNITITVNSTTPAPTGSASQTLCSGSTIADLTATGTNIKWYSTNTSGTSVAATTALENGTTYYASQTVNGCESTTRLAVTVSLNATATIILTSGEENIVSSGCYFSDDIVYTIGNGATGVNVYSPWPNWITTTTIGTTVTISFNNSYTPPPGYWYFEISTTGGCGNATRTFMRGIDGITGVELRSPPGTDNQTICINDPIQDVRYAVTSLFDLIFPNAFGLPAGVTLSRDYSTNEIIFSGTPTETGVFNYFIYTDNGCSWSSSYGGMITVNSTPAPTGANNQTMIQGFTITNLVVTGQNIVWYSTPFEGTPLTLNTPLVNGTTYYASQTINGCESQDRLPVTVQFTLNNNEFDSINIVYNPNPVIDILYIKASTELKNAKICNVLGQTIFQQRFNSNEIQLNMSDFPTGTYFVIVESDDRKETFKILKK